MSIVFLLLCFSFHPKTKRWNKTNLSKKYSKREHPNWQKSSVTLCHKSLGRSQKMWEMWSKAWQENSSNWHFYPSRNAPFRLHSIMGGWENGNILILSGGKFKVILSQFKESNISNMWSVKQAAKFQVWAALSIDLESKNCVDPRSKLLHLKWQVNFCFYLYLQYFTARLTNDWHWMLWELNKKQR